MTCGANRDENEIDQQRARIFAYLLLVMEIHEMTTSGEQGNSTSTYKLTLQGHELCRVIVTLCSNSAFTVPTVGTLHPPPVGQDRSGSRSKVPSIESLSIDSGESASSGSVVSFETHRNLKFGEISGGFTPT
jgi:hypothetical protein